MTSPVEPAVNGIRNNDADPKTSSPPSQQTTLKPKANGINGSAETNGLTTDDSAAISNGEGSNATTESTESHLSIATPTPPTSMSGSQADIMEQIPFGESQQSQSEESDPGEEKRDLYVGNLHPRIQLETLKSIFGGDDCVENVKIVPDRNLSHGGLAYGFVTMRSNELARTCMGMFNNKTYYGLDLRINWATPTKSAEHGLSVFVGDIGPEVTIEDLQNAFRDDRNSVVDARIVMDPNSGRTKGYGFVTFKDQHSAQLALSKNGEILKGRKMRVNWASTTKDQKVSTPQQLIAPSDIYVPPIPPMVRGNDAQSMLLSIAQYEGLDVGWYTRLPFELQSGIYRVSQEAPSAKVIWVGNLDKSCTQHDLMPLFSPYGLIEEVTMVAVSGYAFISMASHLVAATLIVIFKEYNLRGRKIRTGWSHSSQRQIQQQAAISSFPQPHPAPMIPQLPNQPLPHAYQMAPPMAPPMAPIPQMAPAGYMYPQQPILYNPYMQPMHPYPQVVHPINPTNGSSTPRSVNSGAATPSTYEPKAKETPSPR